MQAWQHDWDPATVEDDVLVSENRPRLRGKQEADSRGLNCIHHNVVLECRVLLYSLQLHVSWRWNRQNSQLGLCLLTECLSFWCYFKDSGASIFKDLSRQSHFPKTQLALKVCEIVRELELLSHDSWVGNQYLVSIRHQLPYTRFLLDRIITDFGAWAMYWNSCLAYRQYKHPHTCLVNITVWWQHTLYMALAAR